MINYIGFNRTIVELRPKALKRGSLAQICFNRTIVELRLYIQDIQYAVRVVGFNRTIVELRRKTAAACQAAIFLF